MGCTTSRPLVTTNTTVPADSVKMLKGALLVSPTEFTATTVTVRLLNSSTPEGPIVIDLSVPGTERVVLDMIAWH